jgi:hypothetical protein
MKFISIKEAAEYHSCTRVVIYNAIKRGKLQYKKVALHDYQGPYPKRKWFMYTSEEWLKEWQEKIKDKQFQIYNGKLMYRKDEGDMSSTDVRKYLGISNSGLFYHVNNGNIKYTKRGFYYIFKKEDVDLLSKHLIEVKQKIA